jgi:hypothetical protein
MEKRNAEWEAKKLKFINDRMNELKLEILEHASSELFKENNKKIIAQREAERKARDEAIK